MTPEQLDEIEKLAEAATPGPWSVDMHADVVADTVLVPAIPDDIEAGGLWPMRVAGFPYTYEGSHQRKDATFIAAMREYALPLVKALREAVERDEHHFKVMEQYRLEVEDYKRRMGDLLDQLAREEADAHQFQKERDVARSRLSNLLARIHRDGGHYEAKNGTAKAVVDADAAVAQTFAERDEARAEVEMLRGVGCGELREGAEVADGPCGACLKCARRERDAARTALDDIACAIVTADGNWGFQCRTCTVGEDDPPQFCKYYTFCAPTRMAP